MKCCQCSSLAMYQVTVKNFPLCLDCYLKFSQIQQRELENHERMANFHMDEMSAVTGLPSLGPRFPARPLPVIVSGVRLNNISVNNSVVGTINTGSIGSVDQSISALVQCGAPNVAAAIKGLSEAVLQSSDLTPNQKNEIIESLSVLAKEAATPQDQRRNTVAAALLERATQITALANDVADICSKWWPVIAALFSGASNS